MSELSRKVQKSLDETKKSCNELVNRGVIEIVGKEYMLTAKVLIMGKVHWNISKKTEGS